jgi:hypothetical protein
MDVQMRHGFAAIRTIINDKPKARVVKALLLGDRLRNINQMTQKRFVGDCGGGDARDFLFWNDQNMDRGLGMRIVESQAMVVFEGNPGRDFTGDDLGENRAHIS